MNGARQQPVVTGIDASGKLVWGYMQMPEWQMRMFPLPYYGDFRNHWIWRQHVDRTGKNYDDRPEMLIVFRPRNKKSSVTGD